MRFVRSFTALLLLGAALANAQSIVERRGALAVKGNQIVDKDGQPIQLGGMSFYWNQWGAKYYNKNVVNELVANWKSPIVRAAMAVDSSVGGYLKNPTPNLASITKVVEAAIAQGIYVIIDWHEEMAIDHAAQSADFFRKMARKYGGTPNVIFEIYNEPHNADPDLDPTWEQIKAYAETVIPAIREYSTNLVIVGTPTWSADVDIAAMDPIDPAVYGNVAYTLHFYAGTHGASTRSKATDAMKQGIPLFVTEWGTTNADGGQLTGPSKGKVYTTESTTWLNYLKANNISWCNWSVIDVAEGSAALMSGASTGGGWDSLVDLSPSGQYVRSQILARCEADPSICPFVGDPVPAAPIPGVVGATRLSQNMATAKIADADSFHLGSIDSGDWVAYKVAAAAADTFEIRAVARTAGIGGTITVKTPGGDVAIPVQPNPGNPWAAYLGTKRVVLPAGESSLEVQFAGNGSDLMDLLRLEFLRTPATRYDVPGPIALNGFSVGPVNGGLTVLGEPAAPVLTQLRNAATVSYAVNAEAAGTYTMYVKASSATTGGQLDIAVTSGFKKTRFKVAIEPTGDWRNWNPTWTPMDLGAGANTITLIASGDSTAALFSLSDLRFDQGVGIRAAAGRSVSLHRTGSVLRLSLPAGAFQEASLVDVDGRILSRAVVAGDPSAELPLPAGDRTLWIRLRGASGWRTVAVPPVR